MKNSTKKLKIAFETSSNLVTDIPHQGFNEGKLDFYTDACGYLKVN